MVAAIIQVVAAIIPPSIPQGGSKKKESLHCFVAKFNSLNPTPHIYCPSMTILSSHGVHSSSPQWQTRVLGKRRCTGGGVPPEPVW